MPSLSTLYLGKLLEAHPLMQAITRANRVHEGKSNGLIVDYCGILRHLRKALFTFAGTRSRDWSCPGCRWGQVRKRTGYPIQSPEGPSV